MSKTELPLGFVMALAQNEEAMKRFESMTDYEKRSVIQWAHSVKSKQEMRQLVDNIGSQTLRDPHIDEAHFY